MKKLTLNKETLRALNPEDVMAVKGGMLPLSKASCEYNQTQCISKEIKCMEATGIYC